MTPQKKRKVYSARALKRQVLIFVVLAAVVVLTVLYFSFSKTVITVMPAVQQRTVNFSLTAGPVTTDLQSLPAYDITAMVLSKDVTATETATAAGTGTEEPAKAGGSVTLSNNWSRAQPLQAGTRLLSENGVLFRTTERVDIPAGSTVTTTVVADEPGKQGEIPPSKFEIVALWPGLKDKIYGESAEAFTGGTSTLTRVTQEDINAAQITTYASLERQARAQFEAELQANPARAGYTLVAVSPVAVKDAPGALVDDIATTFPYTASGQVVAVAMDQTVFEQAVRERIEKELNGGERFLGHAEGSPTVTVTDIDAEKQTATVAVKATVNTVVRLANPMFDRTALVNQDKQSILAHFSQFDSIAKTEVRFSAFWMVRAPTLPDHIEIKLLDPAEEK